MKLTSTQPGKPKQRGFSLPEMLITIAVIGIIAGMAGTQMRKINSASTEAAAKRNAQSLSSLSTSANAAGAYHIIPESMGGGVTMSADVLTKGVTSQSFGMEFKINLNEAQILAASKYLAIESIGDDYALVYTAD